MCEHGVNTGQLKLAVSQVDDLLGLAQQWLEQLHHLADHGHAHDASAAVAQVTVMLGEARDRLETAVEALEGDGGDAGVTVELV
ncbi:MAG: dynein gamma chain protein [Coriobacteriia bacterium]